MPNLVNTLVCKELARELEQAEGVLFVSFGGLTVEETESLRDELAEKGVKFRMLRNKLARRVLAGRADGLPPGTFVGNTAVAYGQVEHAILAARVLSAPAQMKAGKVALKAGLLDGRALGPADAAALADVPDRDTLRAMLLGCVSGPARGLVRALNGLSAGLARVLQAHADEGSSSE